MTRTKTELDRVLQLGDVEAVIAFFAGATEAERTPFARQAFAWMEHVEQKQQAEYAIRAHDITAATRPALSFHELHFAGYIAALASASLAELKPIRAPFGLDEEFAIILADRRPPWIAEYCASLFAGQFGLAAHKWRQVRALVRAGLCEPPNHEFYSLGALEGIRPLYNYRHNQRRAAQGLPPLPEFTLEEVLLQERDWLETAFWGLFEIEGTSQTSLANRDRNGHADGWTETLVRLAHRGELPRDRLLDASLSALARDFIQFRASWFSRFHEALQPTVEERLARIDAYLGLMASSIPPTVAFALEVVDTVDAARPLPAPTLLPALTLGLGARAKTVVKTALKIAARVATRDPAARNVVCLTAVTALLHEAADVQKDVFTLLERHGDKQDPALRLRLNEMSGAVAASLRMRLKPWIEESAQRASPASRATPAAKSPAAPPSISEVRRPVSCTDPTRAIVPIATLDELIDRAAAVLEAPGDPDAIERVLDGISRLCDQRPPDFARRTGPLQKRVLNWFRDVRLHYDAAVEQGIGGVIFSWVARDPAAPIPQSMAGDGGPFAFLFQRLCSIRAQIARGQALPLLSAPTHRGGWIEPTALVQRWLAWQNAGATPSLHEQILALLRLAPENRSRALAAASAIDGEAGQALRHALGAPAKPGRTPALWLAAYRSGAPYDDLPEFEKAHPQLGPDAGTAARYTCNAKGENYATGSRVLGAFKIRVNPPYPGNVASELLPVLFHSEAHFMGGPSRPLLLWGAQLWPANRESFFVRGLQTLQLAVDWSDTRDRETRGYLEPLGDSHTEFRPMACLALALGLAAQDAALRGHAQEALIAAVTEGRANTGELGATLAQLLDVGDNKLMRWARSLGEVARVSSAHASVVAELLQLALHADPAHAPKDLGALLELLIEALSETGATITDSKARDYLSALKGSGKAGRLAKQLLRA